MKDSNDGISGPIEATGPEGDIINSIAVKIDAIIQESGAHEDQVVSALVACLSAVIIDGATPSFNIEMRFASAVDLIRTYIIKYSTPGSDGRVH